ncbi:FG-GAP-like repeat-containing protein [Pseudodesulfovibrio sp. zrk46]|uniref:FG-GAP-like repeat-containing protein n=1 Tax=Pseudodesulfovibrio sp. zrk46 TaxID=2725288 RepID=UPI0014492936|nr:FG-GAP-like repeat-containing protein [Pseudodesulfovibrio sp. zrk46]QJB56927.1 hypothetical protein HFN16_11155 [Pseudodesulfovibrio sp. zrk46]
MSQELLFSNLDTTVAQKSATDSPFGPQNSIPEISAEENRSESSVTFEDMDNDGDLDIVVSPNNGQADYWLRNDLGQSAEKAFTSSVFKGITPTTVAFGDLDNDGNQDMVIGHTYGAKIFHNNAEGEIKTVSTLLDTPRTIFLEDVNQDGQTDIVIRDSRSLVVIQGALGTFGTTVMAWPNLGDSALLAIGNFDLTNATLEIITLDANTGYIGMVTSQDHSWQALQTISEVSVSTFIIADLNFDGYDDIYMEDENGNIVWLEGDGTGNLVYHDSDSFMVADTGDDYIIEYTDSDDAIIISEGSDEDLVDDVSDDALVDDALIADVEYIELTLEEIESTLDELGFTSDVTNADPMEVSDTPPPEDETLDYSDSDEGVHVELPHHPPPSPFGPDPEMIDHLIGSDFADELHGNEMANELFGRDGSDKLFGEDGHDKLFGGNGMDLLFGGNGNDFLAGQEGNDLLFGDNGNDTLFGGHGRDILFGHLGNDILHGGEGDDFLSGGDGDDFLYGGMGRDSLVGDQGRDIFHFKSAMEGGDEIRGFEKDGDLLTFEFGSRILHGVKGPYSGVLADTEGEAFVVERTGQFTCKLYYDADTSVAGDEQLLADIEFIHPHEDPNAPDASLDFAGDDDGPTLDIDDIAIV